MQVTIDVEVTRLNGLTLINAKRDDQVIQSTVLSSEIVNIDDLAAWLLAQTGKQQDSDTNLQRRLSINYHIESVNDPETGQPIDQTVIDNVQSEPLPADDGRVNFSAMTGWGTWTAVEVEDWIDINVIDLSSAIVALKAMAKAIVYLRDMTVKK